MQLHIFIKNNDCDYSLKLQIEINDSSICYLCGFQCVEII